LIKTNSGYCTKNAYSINFVSHSAKAVTNAQKQQLVIITSSKA